jgi:hypothetical protein
MSSRVHDDFPGIHAKPPYLDRKERFVSKVIGVITAIAAAKFAALGAFFLTPILFPSIGLGAWLGVTVLAAGVCAVGAFFLGKKITEAFMRASK